MRKRIWFVVLGLIGLCVVNLYNDISGKERGEGKKVPETICPEHLPRWRGFNLLEKFSVEWGNKPFREEDFQWIAELGFNFVRLPMDYRCWIKNNDWNQLDERTFQEIDQAVAWGRKYKIHVNLNFHRAPGYCVNPPQEALNLWTSPEAQKVCAHHWMVFAKRYRGIPNSDLSFDLVNEPSGVTNRDYQAIVEILTAAIHKEDPERLVIADGNFYGNAPVPELAGMGVAQSYHCYQPMGITHYKAPWVEGSERFPVPQWPASLIPAYLYGPQKRDLTGPLEITGNFPEAGTELKLRVQTVSAFARLVVRADDTVVFDKMFRCGPGQGEWQKVVYRKEWDIYQNVFNRDYPVKIPAHTKKITLVVTEGDWLSFSKIAFEDIKSAPKEVQLTPTTWDWGIKPQPLFLKSDGSLDETRCPVLYNKEWLKRQCITPWQELQSKGIGMMVGEWGVYNQTSHPVTIKWMADCLEIWKENGWGWALWNFRGDFGILDSGRKDVKYEDFHGHKLDQQMLKLLQNN
jgi:aryl-phospho-beta-D-glucosidase BglC (GH1 family)